MMKKSTVQVERVQADANVGLNAQQVRERTEAGQTNYIKKVVGKSYLAIFASNIFTFFNLLGIIIFILMLICQSIENMFFFVVILANTALGIFQEIRSKLAIEKLSLVNQPTADVIRDGKEITVDTDKIVIDDIVRLSQGKQICADGKVVEGETEVDESMLTGESDPVKKRRETSCSPVLTWCRAVASTVLKRWAKTTTFNRCPPKSKSSKSPIPNLCVL